MSDNNESSFFGKLLKLAGSFVLANVAGGMCVNKKNREKVAKHNNENNMLHMNILSKGEVRLKPDTDNAYLTCLSGSLDIHLAKPVDRVTSIEITSVLANVNIYVPNDVKVVTIGPESCKCNKSDFISFDDEKISEVHIKFTSYLSRVNYPNT